MYIIIKERLNIDFQLISVIKQYQTISILSIHVKSILIQFQLTLSSNNIKFFNLSEINLDTIPIDIYHQTIMSEKQIILLVTFISNAQISSSFLSLSFILFYYEIIDYRAGNCAIRQHQIFIVRFV